MKELAEIEIAEGEALITEKLNQSKVYWRLPTRWQTVWRYGRAGTGVTRLRYLLAT